MLSVIRQWFCRCHSSLRFHICTTSEKMKLDLDKASTNLSLAVQLLLTPGGSGCYLLYGSGSVVVHSSFIVVFDVSRGF